VCTKIKIKIEIEINEAFTTQDLGLLIPDSNNCARQYTIQNREIARN
jgi:hypothetical protein